MAILLQLDNEQDLSFDADMTVEATLGGGGTQEALRRL